MSDDTKAAITPTDPVFEMGRSVLCLALEVDESIHADVKARWHAVTEYVAQLDQRVHDQTHARIHAELAIESALEDIERGRQYDAEATLRRALGSGSSGGES